ncbi:TetR family transcriptional regulator [Sinomonas sp. P47F7]|uniref:TetR family transcriptional regulator n=1 Tax=Sinomonas sp. P47F7 TaxID=3410987 RepID=UPI003BF585BB
MSTPPTPLADNPGSLRERKKLLTRQAIHDAAYELVVERGLAHVTIGDICARATISERTFFNYFPSKAAATLGLPATLLAIEHEQRFLQSSGPLVDDLCELVANVSGGPDENLPRLRELMRLEPDLLAALHQWTSGVRERVIYLAEQRTTPIQARLSVALVFAALFLHADSVYTTRPGRPALEDLRTTVGRLCSLAAG